MNTPEQIAQGIKELNKVEKELTDMFVNLPSDVLLDNDAQFYMKGITHAMHGLAQRMSVLNLKYGSSK